jgi:hypothetical protein
VNKTVRGRKMLTATRAQTSAIILGLIASGYVYFSGTLDGVGFIARLIRNPLGHVWGILYWVPVAQALALGLGVWQRGKWLSCWAIAIAALALVVQSFVVSVEIHLAMAKNVTFTGNAWARGIAPMFIIMLLSAVAAVIATMKRNTIDCRPPKALSSEQGADQSGARRDSNS